MKLRILGNSIRLRVSKRELESLAGTGGAADAIAFGRDARLSYRIAAATVAAPTAEFHADEIVVTLPETEVRKLVETDLVSIQGEQPLEAGEVLKILVEKDFECLVPRPGEDPRDLFDNPARS